MVDHDTQCLQQAIEEFKDQRERLGRDATAALESIISICSGIVRRGPAANVVQLAVSLRAAAVALYAQPHKSVVVGDLLAECIAKLEQELQFESARRETRSRRGGKSGKR